MNSNPFFIMATPTANVSRVTSTLANTQENKGMRHANK
jgi:hypothetical protein